MFGPAGNREELFGLRRLRRHHGHRHHDVRRLRAVLPARQPRQAHHLHGLHDPRMAPGGRPISLLSDVGLFSREGPPPRQRRSICHCKEKVSPQGRSLRVGSAVPRTHAGAKTAWIREAPTAKGHPPGGYYRRSRGGGLPGVESWMMCCGVSGTDFSPAKETMESTYQPIRASLPFLLKCRAPLSRSPK